jgi:hypothetical protein
MFNKVLVFYPLIVSERLGMVTHIYNPSYSRGRDQEDQGSPLVWAENLGDSPILTNKASIVVHICNPSYMGGKRRTALQGWPLAKM